MIGQNILLCLPRVLRRNLSLPIVHSLLDSRKTDQFLISYPRSGSTWLRTVLGGILDPVSGFEPEVFNRSLLGVRARTLPALWAQESPRIIHSHTCFRRGLGKVVYIVRDGRDSLISFYHYLTTRNGLNVSFD